LRAARGRADAWKAPAGTVGRPLGRVATPGALWPPIIDMGVQGGRMQKFSLGILVLCVAAVLGVAGVQAAETKIGAVDFQRIVKNSNQGNKIEAELKAESDRIRAELEAQKKELEDLKGKLEREAVVMSREVKEEKEIEFRVKVRNLQEADRQHRQDFNKLRAEKLQALQNEVLEIVTDLGKKGNYDLILSEISVLYASSAVDLTDAVIKTLNSRQK
jgi:outer membrane protein